MTRRTKPAPDAPATIWHEAHPGRPDMPVRVCVHPLVKVTTRFAYYARCCRGTTTRVSPLIRIAHAALCEDRWMSELVWDREDATSTLPTARVGQQFSAYALFRAGDVPSPVPRSPKWERERAAAVKRQEAYWRAMNDPLRNAQCAAWLQRVGIQSDHRDDLAALGLTTMPDADGLRRAWQATAKRTHPDAGGTDEAFTRAKAARERLAQVVEHGVATGF